MNLKYSNTAIQIIKKTVRIKIAKNAKYTAPKIIIRSLFIFFFITFFFIKKNVVVNQVDTIIYLNNKTNNLKTTNNLLFFSVGSFLVRIKHFKKNARKKISNWTNVLTYFFNQLLLSQSKLNLFFIFFKFTVVGYNYLLQNKKIFFFSIIIYFNIIFKQQNKYKKQSMLKKNIYKKLVNFN